jgi:tetratricopeptide (TPR) repeat protein
VLVARGAELEASFPFGVARQLLEPPLTQLGDMEREAAFAGAAGLARALFEHPEFDASRVGDAARFAALHGLYWLVANLADDGPMALLVDDAHWADAASLRFVDYLARRVSGLPVALVVAARSGEPAGVEERLLGLDSSVGATVLHPPPLSGQAVARRVRERLGSEPDEAFARACFDATGGNPLFLEELLRALDTGEVEPTAEAAGLVGSVGPDAVARLTLARLDAIGPEAGELARAVAVLGDGVEPRLAASAAGLSEDSARVAADRLAAAGILAPVRRLRFVHPIVRAAVYQRLPPGERAARHADAAAHLARAGAPAERIAAHLLLAGPAGDPARVSDLAEAARIARARGMPESGAAYLRRALEEPAPEEELHGLLLELGRIEHDLHDYAAAEEHLSRALRSSELRVRAEAVRWLARTLMSSGRPDEAMARFDEEIEALAGETPELALGLESELLLAAVWSPGDQPRLGAWLERFEGRAAGLARFEAVAGVHRALRRMIEGATAAEVGDRIEAALATGAIDSLEPSFGWGLRLLQHSEREEVALALVEPALARAREFGHLSQVQLLCAQRAQFLYAQGRVAEALAEAEIGLNAGPGFHPALPLLHAARLDALRERGELDEAEAGLQRAGFAGRGCGSTPLRLAAGEPLPPAAGAGQTQGGKGRLRARRAPPRAVGGEPRRAPGLARLRWHRARPARPTRGGREGGRPPAPAGAGVWGAAGARHGAVGGGPRQGRRGGAGAPGRSGRGARGQPCATGAGAGPRRIRHAAAGARPPPGEPRAPAPSDHPGRHLRRACARRVRARRVHCRRRPTAAGRDRGPGRAHPGRAPRRGAGRSGAHQPRDRADAVRHREDRRDAPEAHLPQAGHPLTLAARRIRGPQNRRGGRRPLTRSDAAGRGRPGHPPAPRGAAKIRGNTGVSPLRITSPRACLRLDRPPVAVRREGAR